MAMNEAKAIKRHAAQHDLFNRLHSIAADESFVRKVAQEWFGARFEVVANQRCGTWYCDPASSSSTYAYFKSTDGHTLNWDFNLRRSNLSLARYAEEKGGLILVDSTRRGKRMPDGLSKTVPIWCCVVNRAIELRRGAGTECDTALYLPAQIVSPSERAQIEALLDGWAADLESSVLPLPDLSKPLRPFFVHPATSVPPSIPASPPYTPIICLSASRWVNGGGEAIPTATRIGSGFFSKTVAFDYVPGAGDDDELWGRGLKPAVYHTHKETLLSTARDDLPDAVDDIVRDESDLIKDFGGLSVAEAEVTPVTSLLSVDLGRPCRDCNPPNSASITIRVVDIEKPAKEQQYVGDIVGGVVYGAPNPRSHAKEYLQSLTSLEAHLRPRVDSTSSILLVPGRPDDLALALKPADSPPALPTISAASLTAPQLQAARKTIIPIAVALMCAFPSLSDGEAAGEVDKTAVADCLHKLVSLWPDGNPPRAALKRVNEFLMTERI